MKGGYWLAIDTATDIASVAAGRPPGSESGAHVEGARRHAAELIRLVDFTLDRIHVEARDLEGIVVGDGPGSFTGLRIGWTAAKGLSQEAGLQLLAVPSLMAAAAFVATRVGTAPVAACFDALRGQVYGAVYRMLPDRVETIVAPAVRTIDELALLTLPAERPHAVVGDGALRYAEAVRAWTGVDPVALATLPSTASMLLALCTRAGAARVVEDLLTAEPTYGRPAEAQAKWEARHGRALPHSPGSTR